MKVNTVQKSLISAIFVFLFSLSHTYSANISLLPSSIVISNQKQDFFVNVVVTDNQLSLNAIEALITFPNDLLEVTSISKENTIISYWVDTPTYSNASGTISFAGVTFNGFTNTKASVIRIHFRPKTTGSALVKINSGRLLANDGIATDVTGLLLSSTLSILDSQNIINRNQISSR